MPEIHVPDLAGPIDDAAPPSPPAPTVSPRRPWNPALRIGLEVILITVGVFLGLAGEQWRQGARDRELAAASLRRFKAEFEANRAEVLRVRDRHASELQGLQAYFGAHANALGAHLVDPRSPIPVPLPDIVTDSAGVDFGAWDFALATQALANIDADLVAAMSSIYRFQETYLQAHRAIQQSAYSGANTVNYLRGLLGYFDDSVVYEDLLLKRYNDIIVRLDQEIANK